MALELLATTAFTDSAPATFVDEDSSQSSVFRCSFENCNREFNSKRNLVDHYRGHHQGKRPHACTYAGCGKSFLRPAHLLIHTRIHTGEKPFVCSFPDCGKRWNQKSALKQHIRSHTGEKPFGCTVQGCNKRFSTSSSCKRHVLTHDKGYLSPAGVVAAGAADYPVGAIAISASKRKHSDTEFSSSDEGEDELLSFSSKRSRSVSPVPSSPSFSSGSSSPAPSSPPSSSPSPSSSSSSFAPSRSSSVANFQSSIADIADLMTEDGREMPADKFASDLSASLGKMAMNFLLN